MIRSRAAAWQDDEATDHEADDPRFVAAIQEYLAALESGDCPARDEFLARHSDIAEQLSDYLEGLELLHAEVLNLQQDEPAKSESSIAADATGHPPLGDFRIVREIGRGGMGVVYEAVQISLGRRVALKVLPFAASLDPIQLQRFKNEAHAAAQLHHSNIVPVYAVGSHGGVHFYAMQLIDGQALSVLIGDLRQATAPTTLDPPDADDGPVAEVAPGLFPPECLKLPGASATETRTAVPSTALTQVVPLSRNYFRTVARLIQQAATALEHAHRVGVIHRDIKPANLLLDLRGDIWITDFGLAQADAQLTRTGDMLGTLRYMSPEQAAGDRAVLDHRTDIYSLGLTLFELLTLQPAMAGNDHSVLVRKIMDDASPSPRAVNKKIPVALDTIVRKAIAKAPADRYLTAQQFADDLERWLEDKPILAKPPSLWERTAQWRRRHRALVTSSVIILLVTLAGLLGSTVVVLREHSKTTRAYQREIKQRGAADESFRQALQAVDTFSQLGEQETANTPEMRQMRRQILQTALEYYNGFLRQRQADPTVQAELAESSERIALIIDELSVLEGFGPLMLLSDEQVQRELKLSDAQSQSVQDILARLSASREDARWNDRGTPQLQQQKLVESVRSSLDGIKSLLNPEQMTRWQQLGRQQRGPFAFKSPEVIAALNLSLPQRRRINEIIEEERPSGPQRPEPRHDDPGRGGPPHGKPPRGGPPHDRPRPGEFSDFSDPREHSGPRHEPRSMHETLNNTVDRILESLTDEQRASWQQLVGDQFADDLRWDPHEWQPH